MSRAPFQILVLPFLESRGDYLYGVFRRNDETGGYWQGIAGGGEADETALAAARSKALEEAGIPLSCRYYRLEMSTMIPVVNVCGFRWGESVLVIPEHAFAVRVEDPRLALSSEHAEYRWLPYPDAVALLKWDSNRGALWELDHRLRHGALAACGE